jgi:hypothetical protein
MSFQVPHNYWHYCSNNLMLVKMSYICSYSLEAILAAEATMTGEVDLCYANTSIKLQNVLIFSGHMLSQILHFTHENVV